MLLDYAPLGKAPTSPVIEPVIQPNPMIAKLGKYVALDIDDQAEICRITRRRRIMHSNDTLVREDSKPQNIFLIVRGFGVRFRFLSDGRRQIFGYLLPGDLCDAHYVVSNECDHSVGLLSESEVAVISTADLMSVMVARPRIERAVLMTVLVDAAILRECLLNVGQRDAFQKLAHFFCEFHARLDSLGEVSADGSYSLPLTQIELADTMGLTVVHVNRMLQRFRHEAILNWSRRRVEILDHDKLRHVAGFNPRYLHLQGVKVEPQLAAYGGHSAPAASASASALA